MSKKSVVIFVEGETDEEFYNALKSEIRSRQGMLPCPVKVINAGGIGNFKNKVIRKFTKDYLPKYDNYDIHVVLCYDTDVFELQKNPPVNFTEISKALYSAGAKKVYKIKAKQSIEDWFLYDLDGIASYLNTSKDKLRKPSGKNGYEKINSLFSSKNKVYIKGKKLEGFISSLNINAIMSNICSEISPLCSLLGLNCDKKQCKK